MTKSIHKKNILAILLTNEGSIALVIGLLWIFNYIFNLFDEFSFLEIAIEIPYQILNSFLIVALTFKIKKILFNQSHIIIYIIASFLSYLVLNLISLFFFTTGGEYFENLIITLQDHFLYMNFLDNSQYFITRDYLAMYEKILLLLDSFLYYSQYYLSLLLVLYIKNYVRQDEKTEDVKSKKAAYVVTEVTKKENFFETFWIPKTRFEKLSRIRFV